MLKGEVNFDRIRLRIDELKSSISMANDVEELYGKKFVNKYLNHSKSLIILYGIVIDYATEKTKDKTTEEKLFKNMKHCLETGNEFHNVLKGVDELENFSKLQEAENELFKIEVENAENYLKNK